MLNYFSTCRKASRLCLQVAFPGSQEGCTYLIEIQLVMTGFVVIQQMMYFEVSPYFHMMDPMTADQQDGRISEVLMESPCKNRHCSAVSATHEVLIFYRTDVQRLSRKRVWKLSPSLVDHLDPVHLEEFQCRTFLDHLFFDVCTVVLHLHLLEHY